MVSVTGIPAKLERDWVTSKGIALIIVGSSDYTKANTKLLKYLIGKKGAEGIYITVNRPYQNLKDVLDSEDIDTSKLIFIDCITKGAGVEPERVDQAIFMKSPQNLTDIAVAISQAIPEKKFIFLDSLSTLMLYNNAESVTQFAQFLTVRLRSMGVMGVLISLEKESEKEIQKTLRQFCDVVLEVGD